MRSSNGDLLALPEGFSYEVVTESGVTDIQAGYGKLIGKTPERPDGTGVFRTGERLRLPQNHEVSPGSTQPVPLVRGTVYDRGASYALAMGVLLVVGGRLCDRYGLRRLFLMGIIGFTAASLVFGLAVNPTTLIAGRLIQGGFGALLIPLGIGMLIATFSREQMTKAVSAFGPVLGGSAVLGPILAGFIIAANVGGLTWRPMGFRRVCYDEATRPIGPSAYSAKTAMLSIHRRACSGLSPIGDVCHSPETLDAPSAITIDSPGGRGYGVAKCEQRETKPICQCQPTKAYARGQRTRLIQGRRQPSTWCVRAFVHARRAAADSIRPSRSSESSTSDTVPGGSAHESAMRCTAPKTD